MSGLAFSALALFVLLLPGLVLQFRYYQLSSAGEVSGTVDIGSARSLVLAIIFSLPIHTFWGLLIWVINLQPCQIGQVDYSELILILQGEALSKTSEIYGALNGWLLFKVSIYVCSQAVFAYFAGKWLFEILQKTQWHRRIALSSNGAIWHKRLTYIDGDDSEDRDPERMDGIVVSATVVLGNTTYIYSGILDYYDLTSEGKLRYLSLTNAARRDIDKSNDDSVYQILGEYLVIDCEKVFTIDIDYVWLDIVDDAGTAITNELDAATESSKKARTPGTIRKAIIVLRRKVGLVLGGIVDYVSKR